MVSAGRDTGDFAFERKHVVEHLRFRMDIADGGVLDRTRQPLGNRKECLVASGLGIGRLATL